MAFGILCVIGNILVLVVIWRFKTLRTKTTLLIVNLAFADLGVGILGFPLAASSNLVNKWYLGEIGCQWYGFSGMVFGLANIGLLTLISFDRYLLTCQHSTFLRLKVWQYMCLITFVWMFAILWAAAPLFGWCRYAVEESVTACLITTNGNMTSFRTYILLVFVINFLTPGIVIIFCYTNAWRFIRSVGDGGRQENVEWTHEKQVAKMCAVAISCFLIAWSPYAFVCLWMAFAERSYLHPLLLAAPSVFAKSSSCYNPVLYAFINKRFRLAIQKMFRFRNSREDAVEMRLHQLEK